MSTMTKRDSKMCYVKFSTKNGKEATINGKPCAGCFSMDGDVTPEQAYVMWIISILNAKKPKGAETIRRIKAVLDEKNDGDES